MLALTVQGAIGHDLLDSSLVSTDVPQRSTLTHQVFIHPRCPVRWTSHVLLFCRLNQSQCLTATHPQCDENSAGVRRHFPDVRGHFRGHRPGVRGHFPCWASPAVRTSGNGTEKKKDSKTIDTQKAPWRGGGGGGGVSPPFSALSLWLSSSPTGTGLSGGLRVCRQRPAAPPPRLRPRACHTVLQRCQPIASSVVHSPYDRRPPKAHTPARLKRFGRFRQSLRGRRHCRRAR